MNRRGTLCSHLRILMIYILVPFRAGSDLEPEDAKQRKEQLDTLVPYLKGKLPDARIVVAEQPTRM